MSEREQVPRDGRRRKLKRPQSPYQQLRQKEARGARRRLVVMGAFVLAALFLTLAMIRVIVKSTAPDPKLYIVQEGTIVSQIYGSGIVARDEVLLDSPAAGFFLPLANDGDKVRRHQVLGRIVSSEGESVWDDLEKIKARLSTRRLELMAQGQSGRAESIYESTDDKLLPLVNQLRRQQIESDLAQADQLTARMQVIVEDRNNRLLDVKSGDETLDTLLNEKAAAEDRLKKFSTELEAPVSGLVSYSPDSQTAVLNGQALLAKTPEEVNQLISSMKEETITASRKVKKKEDIAFLVRGVYQYLGFTLQGQKTSDFPLDRPYDVELPDDGILIKGLTLESAKASSNDLLLLVFKTDQEIESLINRRVVKGKILLESDKGLKVPREALIFPDKNNLSVANVMVVQSGYVYQEQVEVHKLDQDYALVASPVGTKNELVVGSIIVRNPASVKAGEQVGG